MDIEVVSNLLLFSKMLQRITCTHTIFICASLSGGQISRNGMPGGRAHANFDSAEVASVRVVLMDTPKQAIWFGTRRRVYLPLLRAPSRCALLLGAHYFLYSS